MARNRNIWLILLGIIFLLTSSNCEIHRTRTSRVAKAYPRTGPDGTDVSPGGERSVAGDGVSLDAGNDDDAGPGAGSLAVDDQDDGTTLKDEDESYSRDEAWFYAIIATVVVGLTGIIPLFLPFDVNPSADDGAGAARFNCILSFAVGGLLGDVFLHLLPEAWAHISSGDHHGHMTIGLWILVGMLVFLSLEKFFGEEEEEKKEKEAGEQCKNEEKSAFTNGATSSQHHPEVSPLSANGHSRSKVKERGTNGVSKRKPIRSGTSNGARTNGATKRVENGNGMMTQLTEKESKVRHEETPPMKVKVVGYLNLLANFIDNFTHGIAVAGSFLVSKKVGLLTTAAILLHEVPHEVGDFAILLRSGFSRVQAAKSQMWTALGGLLGAAVTLLSESAQEAGDRAAWILPFTAGGFLHIALVTVLPDLIQETSVRESLKQAVCLVAGIAVMATVSLVVE